MKSVFIIFNQANTERVEYMLDMLEIKGFTFFEQVQGRGTNTGEPRRGTHTWPEMNFSIKREQRANHYAEHEKNVVRQLGSDNGGGG